MTEPTNYSSRLVNPDEDASVPPGINPGSPLEALQTALSEDTKLDAVHLRVPRRPTLRLICDPNIDGDLYQRWIRNARIGKDKGANASVDAVKLSAVVLGNTCIGVEVIGKDGEYHEARDAHENPLTFASPELRTMLVGDNAIPSATVLVRKLFGNDGNMMEASGVVLEEAGYSETEEDEVDTDAPLFSRS